MASIKSVEVKVNKYLLEVLKKRTYLLECALSALKQVEYDIDLRIIADIEEELNKGLDENDIRE